MLTKLSHLGIDANIVHWVANDLTSRHQKVAVNETTSDSAAVLSGVPQGSVLGPVLFLIYINDLASLSISVGSQTILYADNLLLYQPISTYNDYCALMKDIAAIEAWSLSNNLNFNASKCKYMVISRKKNPLVPTLALLLNDMPNERVECFRTSSVFRPFMV